VKRADVAHILRAARSLTDETEFVLVGSQAAHASIANLPEVMQQSGELDIYPLRRPELAEVIEGAIGEGSPFHATFGYYAQGVGPETARLPRGWRDRALRISEPSTEGAIGIAPEIHDICASKLVALRRRTSSTSARPSTRGSSIRRPCRPGSRRSTGCATRFAPAPWPGSGRGRRGRRRANVRRADADSVPQHAPLR
jgi:hypothetical protein